MPNGLPPERPDFLDQPGGRVRARQAQIDRLKVKLERTYRSWLTCRSPELRAVGRTSSVLSVPLWLIDLSALRGSRQLRGRHRKYTGTPSSTMTSPGHVVAGR